MWGLCDTYLGTFIGRLITPLLDSPLDITLKRKRTSGESKGVIGYIRNAIWAERDGGKEEKDIGPKHS